MQPNMPPEPHTPEWCAVNPNRCKGDNPSAVPIDDVVCQLVLIVLGLLIMGYTQLRILKNLTQ